MQKLFTAFLPEMGKFILTLFGQFIHFIETERRETMGSARGDKHVRRVARFVTGEDPSSPATSPASSRNQISYPLFVRSYGFLGKVNSMFSHRRSALVVVLGFAGLMGLGVPQVRADITYQLVDYPLDQGGHHLSGTITTDGTIGDLGVDPFPAGYYNYRPQFGGHITGATFQIDNDPSYTVPINDIVNAYAEVVATPTQILLYPGDSSPFELLYNVPSVGVWGIEWQNTGLFSGSDQVSGSVWQTTSTPAGAGRIGANSSWVIATTAVPEPATLVIGAALLVPLGLRRRCGR
jgi:hypothetical protein